MRETELVFVVRSSLEDERPEIDFTRPKCRSIDWLRIDEVLRGIRSPNEYEVPSIMAEAKDVSSWHFFSVAGTFGLFSDVAVRAIGLLAFRSFDLFPAFINGAKYHFLKAGRMLACFDRAESEIVPYQHDPSRIMQVTKYAFHKPLIEEHTLFCIPEVIELFATESVCRAVEATGLKGFRFDPVA